jgi:hypothetical protein
MCAARRPADDAAFQAAGNAGLCRATGGYPGSTAGRRLPQLRAAGRTWQDIRYEEAGPVGFLHFEFYNGAMSSRQCRRLLAAWQWAQQRPVSVIVLMGGRDYWSNGIHLHSIEAAESPADESWANINAIDDLAEAIIRNEKQLTSPRCRATAAPAAASWRVPPTWSGRVPACCSIRTTATWATSTARSTGPTCCRHGSASKARRRSCATACR